jgi:uncharacterized protein
VLLVHRIEMSAVWRRASTANLRVVLGMKMRKVRLPRLICSLVALALPLLSFGQAANQQEKGAAKEAAKAAFLHDLDSARQGDPQAKLRVGRAYNEGVVVWRNGHEAAWWLQQASDEGSMEATAWLGALYLFGGAGLQDVPNGTALLQKAVDADNPIGLRFMGAKYAVGIGVPADAGKAVGFYLRAIAQKDPESYARLGRMYWGGLGIPKDTDRAFELFTAGARLGDQWSQLNLGQMYESGVAPNPASPARTAAAILQPEAAKPNYEKARSLFAASAAQGNRVAEYELGRIYELGLSTARDYGQSFEFYKQSAMQRYVPAIIAVGRAHELGRGTAVNLIHAHVAYSQAVEYSHGLSGVKQLHRVESRLSPVELQHAHEMLKAFKEASEAALSRSLR